MSFSGQRYNEVTGVIRNHPFYPDISLQEFVENYSIPTTKTETLVTHLKSAIIEINYRLDDYRIEQVNAGYLHLSEVPAMIIDDISALMHLYMQAVSFQAKASILRDYATIDRREAAENQAKTSADLEALYELWATEAVNKILKQSGAQVPLS